jgi:hypothetical protein
MSEYQGTDSLKYRLEGRRRVLSYWSVAILIVGLALLGVAAAEDGPDRAITRAALAPYRDELLRNAAALCSDLAHSPIIVPNASHGASCERAVQSAFAATTASSLSRSVGLSFHVTVSHLEIKGHRAKGIFSLSASESAHGMRGVRVASLGRFQLSLEEIGGRWIVSSQARLVVIRDCRLDPRVDCQRRVKGLLFTLGAPVEPTRERVAAPGRAVRAMASRPLHLSARLARPEVYVVRAGGA